MTSRPILFSAPMVRAILEGRKTQTRRTIPHIGEGERIYPVHERQLVPGGGTYTGWVREVPRLGVLLALKSRYGQAGDRLWVRETWYEGTCPGDPGGAVAMYPPETGAGWDAGPVKPGSRPDAIHLSRQWRKRVSIHMPRWASRITLEVTGVRAERLHDITPADVAAEGLDVAPECPPGVDVASWKAKTVQAFGALWDGINGEREGARWADNPHVWVVEFRRL